MSSKKNFFFNFQVKDCDPETGEPDSDEGYNDEYVLEDLEISMSDFVQRAMKVGILISRIFTFEKKNIIIIFEIFLGQFCCSLGGTGCWKRIGRYLWSFEYENSGWSCQDYWYVF